MSSLRKSITTPAMLMLAVAGLSAAACSFGLVTHEINKFLDSQLQELAVNVGPTDRSEAISSLENEEEDLLVVRVWNRSGALIQRSGPPVEIDWQLRPGLSDVIAGGRAWRVYRLTGSAGNVQIAQAYSARREIAVHAATGAILPLLLAIPAVWFFLRWSIDRTMRGLRQLSADIAGRSVDAREHLHPVGVPEEVAPLIMAIDKLVDRHRSALEAQRRFVADAAHELRTPLAALQIQSENLRSEGLRGRLRDVVDELGDGVRRASRLATQMLELAKTEGAAQSHREAINLSGLSTSVLADLFPLAEAKKVELALEADEEVVVEDDRQSLRKILEILLDNAIRYSEPGGTVTMKVVKSAPIAIEVIDEGPGIPKDAMPRIYDRFFRATTQSIEGTGLGLAIAKSVADQRGLELTHQNRSEAGLIARVVFPPRPAASRK